MSLPELAARNYSKMRNDPLVKNLLIWFRQQIGKTRTAQERIKFVQAVVDACIEDVTDDDFVQNLIACKKGCAACCHTQVAITTEEVDHLKLIIKQKNIDIDNELLAKQASKSKKVETYFKLDYEERKCVFLDDENNCQVYEDRPLVCRTNMVIGNSDQCDTRDGEFKSQKQLKTELADVIVAEFFLLSKESGTLPEMLNLRLKKSNL